LLKRDHISSTELLTGLTDELFCEGYTVKGTFKFPRIPNAKGELTPFARFDTDAAFELICDWHFNINKVTGVRWRAFPEIFEKNRKTPTPLHYHALFKPVKEAKFLKVAQRKWINLLRHRYPRCTLPTKPLWLDIIERSEPSSQKAIEAYSIKQQDDYWNSINALRSDCLYAHNESEGVTRFQKVA
tara:strand:+ start:67 stop:624 length:558 start_codon:yes stop_codon:yes gene_type:complete